MRTLLIRAALLGATALALGACGSDEPEAAATDTAAAPAAPTPPGTLAPLQPQSSPYERAQRALLAATSLRFDAEYASASLGSQYLTGARQAQNYRFNVRSAPKPLDADGDWLMQGGRYLKKGLNGYEPQLNAPDGHVALIAAIAALPDKDTRLMPAGGGADQVGGVACTRRSVDLAQMSQIAASYQKLSVCIEEAAAQVLEIQAETRSGERLQVSFSGFGEPVEMPQAEVKEWWQQLPRQQ